MVDKEFTRKTAKLVQEYTSSGPIRSSLDIYEINGDTIKKIEEDEKNRYRKSIQPSQKHRNHC